MKKIKTMMVIITLLFLSPCSYAQYSPVQLGLVSNGKMAYKLTTGNIQIIPEDYMQDEIIIITHQPIAWNKNEQSLTGINLPAGSRVIGCADMPLIRQSQEMVNNGIVYGTQFLVKLTQPNAKQLVDIVRENNPLVSKAYLNAIGQLTSSTPLSHNDPDFSNAQYHMKYDLTAISMGVRYQGWQHASGYVFKNTNKVLVAVLDGGLNFTHQDVVNAYWTNSGEIAGNSIDDDANGYVDDVKGWDCVNSDNDPTDDHTGTWHGTQMFGIIAARNNNGNNICGWITDTASVIVLKVGNSSGSVTDFWTAAGYNYALAKGARIVNMSFGFSSTPSTLMSAIATGVGSTYKTVPVASVGNTGGLFYGYPASGAHVLTVGNANSAGNLYSASSYSDSVDVLDRGVSVAAPSGANNTSSISGTGSSPAAANTSGKVWWVLKAYPSLTVDQVIDTMRALATYSTKQANIGWGYLDGLDTFCYRTMMPDTSVTFTKCGGKKPLPVSKIFKIVDSNRYGCIHISVDSVNTNICPTGTFDYKMAWKSEPRSTTYYLDTFQMAPRYMHFTISGTTGVSTPATAITNSGSNTVCVGTTLTFTKSGNTTAAKRKWYVNGTFIDTTASISYTATGSGVDTIKLVPDLTTSGCWDTGIDTAKLLITKIANVTPSISISANPSGTICSGTSVTFTATPTNGGTSPSYQWKKGSTNVGTNSNTFTSSTLANGDVITCVLTSNAQCASPTTATSSSITMSVTTPVTPSVTIAASATTVCAGTSLTFTATPTNGGSPSYQWKVNGGNVGTNSNTFTSSTLVNGDVITCVMTTSLSCVTSSTATSSGITMTVNANVTPTASVSASATTICGNGGTTTLTATSNVTGVSYQWYKGTSTVGTNSNTYVVSGIAPGSHSYHVVVTTPAGCFVPTTATSNTVSITVTTPTVPTASASATSLAICSVKSDTLTATCSEPGATKQWQKGGSSWNDIPGATSSPYYLPTGQPLGPNKFRCVFTLPTTGCFSTYSLPTNDLTIAVAYSTPLSAPTITGVSIFSQMNEWKGIYTMTVPSTMSQYIIKWYRIVNGADVLMSTTTNTKTWVHSPLDNNHPDTVYAVLIPTDGCWTQDSAVSNTFVLQSKVGVAALSLDNEFNLYPNPVDNGFFFVKGMSQGHTMKVYNIQGQVVMDYTFRENNQPERIEFSNAVPGVYIARFYNEHNVPFEKSVRIVKK